MVSSCGISTKLCSMHGHHYIPSRSHVSHGNLLSDHCYNTCVYYMLHLICWVYHYHIWTLCLKQFFSCWTWKMAKLYTQIMFSSINASIVNTYGHIRCNFVVHSAFYRLDATFCFQDTYFAHSAFVVENYQAYVVRLKNI